MRLRYSILVMIDFQRLHVLRITDLRSMVDATVDLRSLGGIKEKVNDKRGIRTPAGCPMRNQPTLASLTLESHALDHSAILP